MMCMGHYVVKPPIFKKFIKINKCIRTNDMLGKRIHVFILKAFQFNVINAFTTYT